LKKLNSFQEKGMKHVTSAILQIKTIGKVDQNANVLRYKAKMKEIMFCNGILHSISCVVNDLKENALILQYFFSFWEKNLKSVAFPAKLHFFSTKFYFVYFYLLS